MCHIFSIWLGPSGHSLLMSFVHEQLQSKYVQILNVVPRSTENTNGETEN